MIGMVATHFCSHTVQPENTAGSPVAHARFKFAEYRGGYYQGIDHHASTSKTHVPVSAFQSTKEVPSSR